MVISTATWKLDATVGSADLGSLKVGQAASVSVNGARLPGKVASVGIVATSTSDGAATFPVVVTVSGTHRDLFSGTTASAVVTTGSYPDLLTVPTAAISEPNGKPAVSLVRGDRVSSVEVTVGRVFGPLTEITGGLSEGDTVRITLTRAAPTSTTGARQPGGGFGGFGGPPDGAGRQGQIPGGGGTNR